MRYAYFPGCALKGSANGYDISCREVSGVLGIDLVEIPDWNCCGSMDAVHACDPVMALSLAARNFTLAAEMGMEIATLCSACFATFSRARKVLAEDHGLALKVMEALNASGLKLTEMPKIRHYLDILINDAGLDALSGHVKVPLKGLKVAPYYGCLLVRPPQVESFDDREHPVSMDRIVEALGAGCTDFVDKTRCCGASLVLTDEDVMMEMTRGILLNAKDSGADCVVTPCPMCHFNLDAKQGEIEARFGIRIKLPILYITQLIGMAFGLEPKGLGLNGNLVSPGSLLQKCHSKEPLAKV